MRFKLIMTLVNPELTQNVIETARANGATGELIVPARGSGVSETKIFGISLEDQTDLVLFVVEEHSVDKILDGIENKHQLNESGNGIAVVLSIDKVAGLDRQVEVIKEKLKKEQL